MYRNIIALQNQNARRFARSLACLVHGLELVDGPLEAVLHHVAKLKVLLADLVVGHAQNLLDILQSEAVALQSLEGLRAADESLDVFGIDLQNGRAVCWAGQCVESRRCKKEKVMVRRRHNHTHTKGRNRYKSRYANERYIEMANS